MSDENGRSSWLQPLPEAYADEGDMTGRRMFVAALTVITLAIFGGLIWYSYLKGTNDGPVPVVRADNSVIKEKPENPGGLEVPDQDKNVFNRVESGKAEHDGNLGASAELPAERPETVLSETVAKNITTAPTVPNQIGSPTARPEDVAKAVAAIAPSVKGNNGGFLVQLGAFSKEESAQKLWATLKNENAALLMGVSPDVMMIDLGKKGVLYRLRGKMTSTKGHAEDICTALKAKKQACIVVVN